MLAANSMDQLSALAQLCDNVDMGVILKNVLQCGYIEGPSQPSQDLHLLPDGIKMAAPLCGRPLAAFKLLDTTYR